jgi:PEP-CTERM motif
MPTPTMSQHPIFGEQGWISFISVRFKNTVRFKNIPAKLKLHSAHSLFNFAERFRIKVISDRNIKYQNTMSTRPCLKVITVLSCFSAYQADAAIYFNGLVASSTNSVGTNIGGAAEYDTFVSPNSKFTINGVIQTSFLLVNGVNVFAIGRPDPSFSGLGLFFTPTATQLAAPADQGRAPDLYVFKPTPSTSAIPAAGVSVATIGAFSGDTPYSGASSFTIGSETVSVVDWNGTNLTLNVVPEPNSALLFLLGGGMACATRFRRKRN